MPSGESVGEELHPEDDKSSLAAQMAALTPTDRNVHLSERLLEEVQQERNRLCSEATRLHAECSKLFATVETTQKDLSEKTDAHTKCREDIATLTQANKSNRFSLGLTSVAFGAGGSLISQYAGSPDLQNLAYFGWGLVICASAIVLVKVVFDA